MPPNDGRHEIVSPTSGIGCIVKHGTKTLLKKRVEFACTSCPASTGRFVASRYDNTRKLALTAPTSPALWAAGYVKRCDRRCNAPCANS